MKRVKGRRGPRRGDRGSAPGEVARMTGAAGRRHQIGVKSRCPRPAVPPRDELPEPLGEVSRKSPGREDSPKTQSCHSTNPGISQCDRPPAWLPVRAVVPRRGRCPRGARIPCRGRPWGGGGGGATSDLRPTVRRILEMDWRAAIARQGRPSACLGRRRRLASPGGADRSSWFQKRAGPRC